jgi:hypothetical protein
MKIRLEKDQEMITDSNWSVKTSGDYEETDLVEVYNKENPDQKAAYYAIYIQTGTNP